jgi:DNA invertase Pin-like site-specific DNA recombinase
MTNNETNKEPIKAITYSRVAISGGVADRESTLPGQERRCAEHAKANGYSVVAAFRDVGSGIKGDRPDLNRMLKLIEERRGENLRVLITDPHRLARSVETFLALEAKIREAGGVLEPLEPSRRDIANAYRVRLTAERDRER